ncbi:hypothetical protein LIER_31689 [Lithospermum erythrorhizon]|uniref:Transposase n=1 Tax=Lithospermum erythrorhizon TaxID=34254 RepID=A0AAV3RRP8_LITER
MADGAYNGIIGRPALSQFEAVVFPIHLKRKFHPRNGIDKIQGSQKKEDRNVYTLAVPDENTEKGRLHEAIRNTTLKGRDPKRSPTPRAEHEATHVRTLRGWMDILVWTYRLVRQKKQTGVETADRGMTGRAMWWLPLLMIVRKQWIMTPEHRCSPRALRTDRYAWRLGDGLKTFCGSTRTD